MVGLLVFVPVPEEGQFGVLTDSLLLNLTDE